MPGTTDISDTPLRRERLLIEAGALSDVLEQLVACAATLAPGSVAAVTVALADSEHEIRHWLAGQPHSAAAARHILLVDAVYPLAPSLSGAWRSWFGSYARSDHQLLFPGWDGLTAVALAPLVRRSRLIGSINIGSRDPGGLRGLEASGELERLRFVAALAIENAVNAERLRRSGFLDLLTGWHNRHYLESRLIGEVARSARTQRALACVLADIDGFRALNARYGHRVGDEVLVEVAQRIEAIMRRSDVAARCGGAEFILLLPNTDERRSGPLVDRVRQAVCSKPVAVEGAGEIDVDMSFGVAEHRPAAAVTDPKLAGSQLLARARLALYEARTQRNQPRGARS